MEEPVSFLGGRLILINSVLDALPTYMVSLFPIPPQVEKNGYVEKQFFCGKETRIKEVSILSNGKP